MYRKQKKNCFILLIYWKDFTNILSISIITHQFNLIFFFIFANLEDLYFAFLN